MIKEHYYSIDNLKGICIFFIIITHYSWQEAERLKLLFPFWIDMAVPLFMIISGFVYTLSFIKRDINDIGKAYNIDLILPKMIRYSVPFTIAFAIEEILVGLTGSFTLKLDSFICTFLNGGIGPGSYYYPIMMQFIFFFPIIYFIIRKYDYRGVIICGGINFVYELLKWSYGMNVECYRLLIFRYTFLIAYGCYLAMGNYKRHWIASIICFITGLAFIIICKYLKVSIPIMNHWPGTGFIACLFIVPISAPLIVNKYKNSILAMIGKASFNIFLVQMVYYNNISGFLYNRVKGRIWQLGMSIIICISLGILFYFIESPLTKLIINRTNMKIEHKRSIKECRDEGVCEKISVKTE